MKLNTPYLNPKKKNHTNASDVTETLKTDSSFSHSNGSKRGRELETVQEKTTTVYPTQNNSLAVENDEGNFKKTETMA